MGTPKSPMSRRIWRQSSVSPAPAPARPPPSSALPPQSRAHPRAPRSARAAVPPAPRTRPGKNRLFLNLRRKKAMKKVPAMSTSDSSAVLGCPVTLVAARPPVPLAGAVLPSRQASASVPLSLVQLCRGCSWKICGSGGGGGQAHPGPRTAPQASRTRGSP